MKYQLFQCDICEGTREATWYYKMYFIITNMVVFYGRFLHQSIYAYHLAICSLFRSHKRNFTLELILKLACLR